MRSLDDKNVSKKDRKRPTRSAFVTNFCSGMDLGNQRIQSRTGSKEAGRNQILTTRDSVAGDALPSEPTAHSAREVVETGLAGAVGVSFVVWDHDPFNRTNLAIVNERET